MNKHKLNYFEIIAFINNLEKKYRGKYYPYPSPNKNKKNKETHLLIRLEKYPENWVMVLKYKEVNLAAKNKIQKIPVNKISNGKINYLLKLILENKAKCFCNNTVKFNQDFEKRSKLICKIEIK